MVSFKGILKGLAYLGVAGWMFFLGILVGRGSSPVTFDTHPFQKRLEIIAREFGKTEKPETKIDLEFYDALTQPVQPEMMEKPGEEEKPEGPVVSAESVLPGESGEIEGPETPLEIIPPKEIVGSSDPAPPVVPVPVKTSKKAATRNKEASALSKEQPSAVTPTPKTPALLSIDEGTGKKPVNKDQEKAKGYDSGLYTIQIAAYTSFIDAVTHMATLEEKGVSSHRVVGEKNGKTWYRIRAGSFNTHKEAAQFLEQLNQKKINGMIIKKE